MADDSLHETVIEPGLGIKHYWRDLWLYRELFAFLVWRDILVRYKQTAIGIAWSIIRPFISMVVFTIVFGKLAGLPSKGAPYPVMVYAAMLPWQLFSNSVSESSNSFINNSNLISKVYFPRLIIPSSSVIVGLVDFILSFCILVFLMLWYKFVPDWRIISIPLFLCLALLLALGAGFWFSVLNVKYRDFRYIVPFIVQFSLFISPVGFSSSIVPEKWKLLYSINPMVGVIDGFRWAILGADLTLYRPGFIVSVVLTAVVFVTGFLYLRKTEKNLADII